MVISCRVSLLFGGQQRGKKGIVSLMVTAAILRERSLSRDPYRFISWKLNAPYANGYVNEVVQKRSMASLGELNSLCPKTDRHFSVIACFQRNGGILQHVMNTFIPPSPITTQKQPQFLQPNLSTK